MRKIFLFAIMALSLSALTAAAGTDVTSCKGCHGQDFGKKALGISGIVKDMSVKDVYTALKGYKDGTFGGPMKGVMKGQVASLSDKDMKSIAVKIGKK